MNRSIPVKGRITREQYSCYMSMSKISCHCVLSLPALTHATRVFHSEIELFS